MRVRERNVGRKEVDHKKHRYGIETDKTRTTKLGGMHVEENSVGEQEQPSCFAYIVVGEVSSARLLYMVRSSTWFYSLFGIVIYPSWVILYQKSSERGGGSTRFEN